MSATHSSRTWQDLDEDSVLENVQASIHSVESLNFVVDFNDSKAECAVDLDVAALKDLWDRKKSKPSTFTWINIWAPEKQVDLLSVLAERYSFSPRLLALMSEKPISTITTPAASTHRHTFDYQRAWKDTRRRKADLENHISLDEKPQTSTSDAAGLPGLGHYRIANEIWHYSSVDLGQEYVCVGYNSLYNTHVASSDDKKFPPKTSSKPAGRRVWNWLLLCQDGTVISIQENLYPNGPGSLGTKQPNDLNLIRKHTLNVLKRLSKARIATETIDPIMALTIRSDPNSSKISLALHNSASEPPGLLFYYLFDDWVTSYSLVAKKDHQYGTQLEVLRAAMFQTASLDHVNTLHHYGRQLAVLKRIYESYDRIIERLLDMQKRSYHSSLTSTTTTGSQTSNAQQTLPSVSSDNPLSLGVPMSHGATVRFETLRDRIRQYALSEIQECIDEKEALVQVNFNLIGMKESSAVETLTRITILLAKVTILFLPVSLMTSYFALQIPSISDGFTLKVYWITFAVTMALSFVLLVAFGILSGTQESRTIYRSLTRTFFDKSRHMWSKKSPAKDRDE